MVRDTNCDNPRGQSINSVGIQLFRERLSERVDVTISKGIVGGFAFTQVHQGNLKEWHERPWIYVCEC